VTGVQTCALPILSPAGWGANSLSQKLAYFTIYIHLWSKTGKQRSKCSPMKTTGSHQNYSSKSDGGSKLTRKRRIPVTPKN
jgi:hypothetical protein